MTLTKESWASAPPLGAVGQDTLSQPTGLPCIESVLASPTVQSSRFLNAPGRAPACSGVQNNTPVLLPIKIRRRCNRVRERVVVVVGAERRQAPQPVVGRHGDLRGERVDGAQHRGVGRPHPGAPGDQQHGHVELPWDRPPRLRGTRPGVAHGPPSPDQRNNAAPGTVVDARTCPASLCGRCLVVSPRQPALE